jgi:hypothetical protein
MTLVTSNTCLPFSHGPPHLRHVGNIIDGSLSIRNKKWIGLIACRRLPNSAAEMVSDLDLAYAAEVVDKLLTLLHGHRLDASLDLSVCQFAHGRAS